MTSNDTATNRVLDVRNVELNYGKFVALRGLDIHIAPGEVVAVIGANGAGKSSLIKAVCGIEPISAGEILFQGESLQAHDTGAITRMGIGHIPEGRKIFPSLSVEENIILGRQLGSEGDWNLERIYSFFPELFEKRALGGAEVSGGQQQMIAIARALMSNPKLLLCDEISLGLAPIIIDRLYKLVSELLGQGLSVLIVEQAVHKSLEVADRFYCLLEGRVSMSGPTEGADPAAISNAYFGM